MKKSLGVTSILKASGQTHADRFHLRPRSLNHFRNGIWDSLKTLPKIPFLQVNIAETLAQVSF